MAPSIGDMARSLQTDVTVDDQLRQWIHQAVSVLVRSDCLVNNVGSDSIMTASPGDLLPIDGLQRRWHCAGSPGRPENICGSIPGAEEKRSIITCRASTDSVTGSVGFTIPWRKPPRSISPACCLELGESREYASSHPPLPSQRAFRQGRGLDPAG